jgi:voltage-dependent calcium channel
MDQPRRHLQSTSTSSAVDLTGTLAGLAASLPPSPSLSPKDRPGSVTRRRPSWSAPKASLPHPTVQINTRSFSVDDDPFASPVSPDDDTPPRSRIGSSYLTTQSGPSSASLIPTFQEDEDDDVHLTVNPSHQYPPGWSVHDLHDPESPISPSPKSRLKSNRYSTSPSPLKKTGTTLQSVSRSLRHMSLRVVNLAGRGLDDHVRLDDLDDEIFTKQESDDNSEELESPALPDLRKSLPIRGYALGFMGPTNPVRLFMYRLLLSPCVISRLQTTTIPCLHFFYADGQNLQFFS